MKREKVFGKKDSYLLTNTRASYAQNEIKCTEQDSVMLDLMQFQMEELASEIGDRRVILEDMIVVEKYSLFCRSRGTKTRGINVNEPVVFCFVHERNREILDFNPFRTWLP